MAWYILVMWARLGSKVILGGKGITLVGEMQSLSTSVARLHGFPQNVLLRPPGETCVSAMDGRSSPESPEILCFAGDDDAEK